MEQICALPQWQHFTIILAVQIVIGLVNIKMSKTESLKSNSVEELILRGLASMVKRLFNKGA